MNRKYRWALLGALLAFSTSAFADIPSTPPPVTPDPEPPSVVNDNDNTAVGIGLGLGYGEGGDGGEANANSESSANATGGSASSDSSAVVGDTTAIGLGGSGGDGGAGGAGGDGGDAAATGGTAVAAGGHGTGGDARQGQGQSQGISSSGNSSSTSAGGAANAVGGDQSLSNRTNSTSAARGGDQSQSSSSGGNSISVDASSSHRSIWIPSVTQGITPSIVPSANIQVVAGALCGPRYDLVERPVYGTFHGLIKSKQVPLGYTYSLEPSSVPFRAVNYPDGSTRFYGHQITAIVAAMSTSGARSLALGGGGSRGDWGQGSLGTSGANQQLVTQYIRAECELGGMAPPDVTPPRYVEPKINW